MFVGKRLPISEQLTKMNERIENGYSDIYNCLIIKLRTMKVKMNEVAFKERTYDVGLSYASEQKEYVEKVAMNLRELNINVFYDKFNEDSLWGLNLADILEHIYSERCKYVVMFISKEYKEKAFPNLERQAALSKALQSKEEYILPIRFDDTSITGLLKTLCYIDATNVTPKEIAIKIANKLGLSGSLKANQVMPPINQEMQGIVEFNYTNNDGRFLLGKDTWSFETKWTAAGSDSIHVYNEGKLIKGVAIAEGIGSINQITDATALDYTSRCRTPHTGEIVVYENKYGFFCAIKILDIKYKGIKGATTHSLKLSYKINLNGVDFSNH